VDVKRAALGRDAGTIERVLQLRLVAQQQGHGFRPLHGDFYMRGRIGRAIDADLHLAEFGRL
jgi:hypothetical protein